MRPTNTTNTKAFVKLYSDLIFPGASFVSDIHLTLQLKVVTGYIIFSSLKYNNILQHIIVEILKV